MYYHKSLLAVLLLLNTTSAFGQQSNNFVITGYCKERVNEKSTDYWSTFSFRIIRYNDSVIVVHYHNTDLPLKGHLVVTDDSKSCFIINISMTKPKGFVRLLDRDYLTLVKLDSVAVDNSQLVKGRTVEERCSLYGSYSILELLATGASPSKNISKESVEKQSNSNVFSQQFDGPAKSRLSIEKLDGKIRKVSIDDINETSAAEFSPPISSLNDAFSAEVTVNSKHK